LFCYINFPRCDPAKDLSFPTCRSACLNFVKACQYSYDLKRCGKTKYFNGYYPEKPGASGTYYREYFPGQPFRTNKYTLTNDEIPICTPALVGAASSNYNKTQINTLMLYIFISLFLCICLILY
jgi:hypothetical protein